MTGKRYMDIDVVAFLYEKMLGNTKHFQSDFDVDKKIFDRCVDTPRWEDKTLLWMSRPLGTECNLEYEAFIRDSAAHNKWIYYSKYTPEDSILAYTVELTGRRDGVIRGNVYELDYPALAKELAKLSSPLLVHEKIFQDGYIAQVPPERSSYGYYITLGNDHGPVVDSIDRPKDKGRHTSILAAQKAKRDMLEPVPLPASPESLKIPLAEQVTSAQSRKPSLVAAAGTANSHISGPAAGRLDLEH